MNNQKAATVDRFHDRVSFSIGDVTDTLYMSPEFARKFANQILITVGDIEAVQDAIICTYYNVVRVVTIVNRCANVTTQGGNICSPVPLLTHCLCPIKAAV